MHPGSPTLIVMEPNTEHAVPAALTRGYANAYLDTRVRCHLPADRPALTQQELDQMDQASA